MAQVSHSNMFPLINPAGAAKTGGEMSANAENSSGTAKSAMPTASESATSGAEAAPGGGATAGAAAGAGAAAEGRAGTGSTEEAEVREERSECSHTSRDKVTGDQTQVCSSSLTVHQ